MTLGGLITNTFLSLGEGDEKGKVMGIFRSLGALSRATGPFVACVGERTGRLAIYLVVAILHYVSEDSNPR